MDEFLQAFALVSMIVFIIVLIIFTVLTAVFKFYKKKTYKKNHDVNRY